MNLDNLNEIKALDKQDMLGSLQLLNKQVEQVWKESEKLKVPSIYKKVQNVVVLGMGGSALGAHIIKNVFSKELKASVEIVNDYSVPAYINQKTLVVASSYSGSTEETVAGIVEAKKKKAKILVICAGGKLADFAKKNKLPALVFTTGFNPCNSPRMGLGYSIVGQLALFNKLGLLKLTIKQIKGLVENVKKFENKFGVNSEIKNNLAKTTASKLLGKSVWYVASEHLLGNAHTAANQLNENAKCFGGYFPIPELNHHLMEGMIFPKSNPNNLIFVFLESGFYHKRIQKRFEVTKDVLKQNKIAYTSYQSESKNKLEQSMEVLLFGAYVSFYLSMLSNIDPTPIPFVDYFKKEMSK